MKLFTLLLFVLLAGISCKKEDASCSGNPLLYNINWLLVDQGTDTNNDGVIENSQFMSLPDCWKDDYYIFQCHETLVKLDNANQCLGRDPEAEIHWEIINDSTIFIRDEGYRVIKSLTATILQYRTSQSNGKLPTGGAILYQFENR